MGERILPSGIGGGSFFQFLPPSPSELPPSPIRPSSIPSSDRERYFAELLAEGQKLGPFLQVLPQCARLLTQEIRRVSSFNQGFMEHERHELEGRPFRPLTQHPLSMPMDMEGWHVVPLEEHGNLQRVGLLQAPPVGWHGTQGVPETPIVKKVIRLDVPIHKYPNDESPDHYKKQQLKELAMLNGTLREESSSSCPSMSPSMSPFDSSNGMKRAKIGR